MSFLKCMISRVSITVKLRKLKLRLENTANGITSIKQKLPMYRKKGFLRLHEVVLQSIRKINILQTYFAMETVFAHIQVS